MAIGITAMKCPLLSMSAIAGLNPTAYGQPNRFKGEMQAGHVSPNMAKLTYPSGTTRNVMILGIGIEYDNEYRTHAIRLRDEAESVVTVWIDTIRLIRNGNDESAVFVLKNGTERRLWFIGDTPSVDNPRFIRRVLMVANDDGGQEKINIARLASVEFVTAPRKDKASNAMFERWLYSPFTGERLPEK